jgi:putative SOS response-associated peptidase YedK
MSLTLAPAPAIKAPAVSAADMYVAMMWGLTPAQWDGMTDSDRVHARAHITNAPNFGK